MTIKQWRSKCDGLWYEICMNKHPYCEACGRPTQQIHHFWHKGSIGHLRYDLDNGIGLCMHCHSLLHFRDAKIVESVIIERRGQKWYDELLAKSRTLHSSYKNVGWYKSIFEELTEIHNKL